MLTWPLYQSSKSQLEFLKYDRVLNSMEYQYSFALVTPMSHCSYKRDKYLPCGVTLPKRAIKVWGPFSLNGTPICMQLIDSFFRAAVHVLFICESAGCEPGVLCTMPTLSPPPSLISVGKVKVLQDPDLTGGRHLLMWPASQRGPTVERGGAVEGPALRPRERWGWDWGWLSWNADFILS